IGKDANQQHSCAAPGTRRTSDYPWRIANARSHFSSHATICRSAACFEHWPLGPWREDNNNRADPYATVEVNHVLVGHANAARRDGAADLFWLVGAVDPVLRVHPIGVQI